MAQLDDARRAVQDCRLGQLHSPAVLSEKGGSIEGNTTTHSPAPDATWTEADVSPPPARPAPSSTRANAIFIAKLALFAEFRRLRRAVSPPRKFLRRALIVESSRGMQNVNVDEEEGMLGGARRLWLSS